MAKTAETSELGLKRELGLLDTVSIEVGGIIGAGIFARCLLHIFPYN